MGPPTIAIIGMFNVFTHHYSLNPFKGWDRILLVNKGVNKLNSQVILFDHYLMKSNQKLISLFHQVVKKLFKDFHLHSQKALRCLLNGSGNGSFVKWVDERERARTCIWELDGCIFGSRCGQLFPGFRDAAPLLVCLPMAALGEICSIQTAF